MSHAPARDDVRYPPLAFPAFLSRTLTYRRLTVAAGVLALAIVAWAVVILLSHRIGFAMVTPRGESGLGAAGALTSLFAALVLILFPRRRGSEGLSWIAAALVVLGMGSLIFSYLGPLAGIKPSVNMSAYEFLSVRILSGVLLVIALLPRTPLAFTRRRAAIVAIVVLAAGGALTAAGQFPTLIHTTDLAAAARLGDAPLPGLTAWHWGLSAVSLALALAATLGAARRKQLETFGGWLLIAMVFLAGSQLHNLFWPSVYSPVLSTADLLRFAFAATVTLWAILELRGVALQRTALLQAEREESRRLIELNELRSSFSSMVAHELANPLAAVRFAVQVLESGRVKRSEQSQMLASIRYQVEALTALVSDVQAAARMEREDFSVHLKPVLLADVLAEATAYAVTLPGEHPISIPHGLEITVLADETRLTQVLRNLLSNAAKYSPAGAPIEIHVHVGGTRITIEVEDHGYGIADDDRTRVFEKFGRGRSQAGRRVPGVGLGLYLSRRIMQTHGSELTLRSELGKGSVFAFALDIAS